MKKVFTVLLLFMITSSSYASDPLIEKIWGEAGVVLDTFLIDSSEGNFDSLPKSMSPEFLEIEPKDIFIYHLKRNQWKIEKYVILTSYTFKECKSFVVDYTAMTKDMRDHGTVTVYLIETEDGWKLWNFPFAPSRVRNFPKESLTLTPKN